MWLQIYPASVGSKFVRQGEFVSSKVSLRMTVRTSNLLWTIRQLNGSHGNGNQRVQWDLIADGSGNYVDKLVDMTDSIIALSFYYISAQ